MKSRFFNFLSGTGFTILMMAGVGLFELNRARAETGSPDSATTTVTPPEVTPATAPDSQAETNSVQESQVQPKAAAPAGKKSKRVYKVDKDTEGTSAPNRFQADTVIKSQYKFEGEQLEVDPD